MNYPISTKRHSLAHILAQAVKELYPNSKLWTWPDTDNGFYYDIDLWEEITEKDLKQIEKKMKNIIKQNQKFNVFSKTIAEADKMLDEIWETYKKVVLQKIADKWEKEVTFYENLNQKWERKFMDLCEWPHVEKTLDIDQNSFKIEKIAWAYFQWDDKNPMLTRIYWIAFDTAQELQDYEKLMAEAKKRDHRVLWEKLKLFTISPLIWAWLPLMQPNWMIIRKELEDYLWDLHKRKWYKRVCTPHIAKLDLYETSGHAQKFWDELFKVSGKEEDFILKPMNCPHHMQIFADNDFSYRDMPIRYFEPATVYRDEKSGQLSGLTRVRSITQDDWHLFCRIDQIEDEVKIVTDVIKEFYSKMWMTDDYWVSLSVRGEDKSDYLWSDDVWEKAESSLEKAAKANDLPYKKVEWEAAFYGPKLDFMFKDCIWREWQLATIQCDFNLPERFDLWFTNSNWEKERPVVIHRAIWGSLERLMWILIEHFGGSFPLWMAPNQVKIIPVMDKANDYCKEIFEKLNENDIRVEADFSTDWLNKKVRNAEKMRTNYMLVVWEEEMKNGEVSVRNYKTKEQANMKFDDFLAMIQGEISEKKR